MAKVLGIGGIFFKSADPAALGTWYRDVLGLEVEDWGGVAFRPEAMAGQPGAATVVSPFAVDSDYFAPSIREFMINLAVDDLEPILASCAAHGIAVTVLPDQPNGRFAHLLDLEGTKIELWQPAPTEA